MKSFLSSQSIFVFLLFLTSRLVLILEVNPLWFTIDEIRDSCIKPWQLLESEPEYRDTNLLPILLYGSIQTFGELNPNSTRVFTIIVFSLLMVLFYLSSKKIFGTPVALLTATQILISHQFILRSTIATTMPSGFWFPVINFYLLLSKHKYREILLAISILCSLFCYPSGAAFSIALTTFYCIFFYKNLSAKTKSSLFTGAIFCTLIFSIIRMKIFGTIDPRSWGIDHADFYPKFEGIHILVYEIFVSSNSWYSFSGGSPAIGSEVIGLIIIFALLFFYNKVVKKNKIENFDLYRVKWLFVIALAFTVSLIAISCNLRQIGIRRILPAIPFLILILNYLLFIIIKSIAKNSVFLVCGIIILFCTGYRTIQYYPDAVPKNEHLYKENEMETLIMSLAEIKENEHVYISYNDRPVETPGCFLYFNSSFKGKPHYLSDLRYENLKKIVDSNHTLLIDSSSFPDSYEITRFLNSNQIELKEIRIPRSKKFFYLIKRSDV